MSPKRRSQTGTTVVMDTYRRRGRTIHQNRSAGANRVIICGEGFDWYRDSHKRWLDPAVTARVEQHESHSTVGPQKRLRLNKRTLQTRSHTKYSCSGCLKCRNVLVACLAHDMVDGIVRRIAPTRLVNDNFCARC